MTKSICQSLFPLFWRCVHTHAIETSVVNKIQLII
uniref:Uncharacterized protein n=1 Tax=Arundo donax TaxID=35708 RepID=A0A0A8ZGV4_ARUDO